MMDAPPLDVMAAEENRRRVRMLLVWGFQKNCFVKWMEVISMGSEE
jgi:hypothetical protein